MYKGGPHLVCGDVGISPYRRLSAELDARGSVRVRVSGCDVRRRPEVLLVSCRGVACRIVSCHVVSCRFVSFRVVSCRVVACRVVGGICTGSVTVETVVLLVFYHVGDGGRGWRCSSCYQCVADNAETGALRVCSRERLG